jgi:hypothetical protein
MLALAENQHTRRPRGVPRFSPPRLRAPDEDHSDSQGIFISRRPSTYGRETRFSFMGSDQPWRVTLDFGRSLKVVVDK